MSIRRRNNIEKFTWKTHPYLDDFENQIHVKFSTSNRFHNFHVDWLFKIDEILDFDVESMANRWKCVHWVFSYQEMQRSLIETKAYYQLFHSVWKEKSHKPLNLAAAKKSFPSVFTIDTTCFNECFLIHVITRRHCFLYKLIVTQKQIFWKKSTFYIRYLLNNIAGPNITMLIITKIHN